MKTKHWMLIAVTGLVGAGVWVACEEAGGPPTAVRPTHQHGSASGSFQTDDEVPEEIFEQIRERMRSRGLPEERIESLMVGFQQRLQSDEPAQDPLERFRTAFAAAAQKAREHGVANERIEADRARLEDRLLEIERLRH